MGENLLYLQYFDKIEKNFFQIKGSITNKTFFPESHLEYPILTQIFFLVKGQNWLSYGCFSTQNVAFRSFYEVDRSFSRKLKKYLCQLRIKNGPLRKKNGPIRKNNGPLRINHAKKWQMKIISPYPPHNEKYKKKLYQT